MNALAEHPPVARADGAPEPPPRRGYGRPALAALLVLAFVVLLHAGSRTGFYFDEWNFVLDRRGWNLDALLLPHNEHLSVVPVLAYKLLFATVGIDDYLPYRLVGLATHLLVVALLFVYVRRRVGDLLALGAATILAFLGSSSIDVLWPFQIGFLGSLAAGIGALLALDREDRRGDVVAGVLLLVALACSSLGVPLLLAAALEVLGRPDRRARWPVIAAPLALYALWYVTYRSRGTAASGGITADNFFAMPGYVMQAGAGAAGALFGLDADWGRILLLVIVAGLALLALRPGPVPWRLAALVAAPLAFWALTALTRANLGEPTAPRYLYPGVAFLLLIGAEVARGWRPSPRLLALLAVVLAGVTVSNVGAMRSGAGGLRDQATLVSGSLTATEIAGNRFPPGFQPDTQVAPQVVAGPYLAAVRDVGSPAPTAAELVRAVPAARAKADQAFVRGYALAAIPAAPPETGSPPAVERAEQAAVATQGACASARPQGPGSALTVTVPPGGLTVAARGPNVKVGLRRFGDDFTDLAVPAAAGAEAFAIRIPSDGDGTPWHARISFDAPARVCPPPA